jgi:hypothetical protein
MSRGVMREMSARYGMTREMPRHGGPFGFVDLPQKQAPISS